MDQPPELLKKLENAADKLQKAAFRIAPVPISAFGTPYASFQRRMLAAGVDTLVLSLTLLPISFWLTNMLIGQVDMNPMPLLEALQPVTDPVQRSQIIAQFLIADNRMAYFIANSFIQMVVIFIYSMICWKHWRATPGKMVLRLVVVDERHGGALSYADGFWRCVGYVLASLPLCLGVLWIHWDKKKQGWHDKLAHSVVIIKPRRDAAKQSAA